MLALNILASFATSALRFGAGIFATPAAKLPEKMLQLYEFEGCPHCRLVRDVLTELDLDVLILPCPKGGHRYRDVVMERGGKTQFPYFVDPNSNVEMYESADIIKYLFTAYGECTAPWHWRVVELHRLSSSFASIPRMGLGTRVRASQAPQQPLELYSFESSPFARPVRDALCELEIPYILRSAGHGSRNRLALLERCGVASIPYLIDPNGGAEMAGCAAIIDYLKGTYRA